MRRLIATVLAALGASLLVSSGALFATGMTAMNAMLAPESEEFVATQGIATEGAPGQDAEWHPPVPSPDSPADPSAGAHDVDPFDVPPGTSPQDAADARIVNEQQRLIAECMLEHGFAYPVGLPSFITGELPASARWLDTLTPEQRDAANAVLWGDSGLGAEYRWEDAGCVGRAVHLTGQDGVH